MPETYIIRSACAGDEATIKALIRREHLDPLNVHWQNFVVAEEAGRVIGVGQVKPYRSGRELGSLVVVPERRQSGVAGTIINALLARESGPLLLFCLAFREPFYGKFGFRRVGMAELPGEFKLKYALGMAFLRLVGQRIIVMQRPAGLPDSP
jgi:N-acetylglutamate synthase-like GNAT family acetyltransferase